MRENRPKPGSFFLYDIFANTGKPCKILIFCSCGEYARFSLCLPKYGRFASHLMADKGL